MAITTTKETQEANLMTSNNEMELNDIFANDIFVPEVIQAQEDEGKEIGRILIRPDSFCKEAMYSSFNINQWIEAGFNYTPYSLFAPNKDMVCSHLVTINHVLRFNTDYNKVVSGTTELYHAQNANHDRSSNAQYNKGFPSGNAGEKMSLTGRGLVAGLLAVADVAGLIDYDNLAFSKFYSHAESDSALREALDDILNKVKDGVPHVYEADVVKVALSYQQTNEIASISKKVRKDILQATNRTETPINSVFSFSWQDYGIVDKNDPLIENIHNINRAYFEQYLGAISKASGVQPGQYAHFVVMGFAYSANFNKLDPNKNYTNPAIFVRFHHNMETHLPAGIVVLCKPVKSVSRGGGVVGKPMGNGKNRLLKALGNRVTTPTSAPVPSVETELVAPVLQDIVLPPLAEVNTVTTEVTPPVKGNLKRLPLIESFEESDGTVED